MAGTPSVGGPCRGGLRDIRPARRLRTHRGRDAGAGHHLQGWFLPGAGAGAYLLLPGPTRHGRAARRANL